MDRNIDIALPSNREDYLTTTAEDGSPNEILRSGIGVGSIQVRRGASIDNFKFVVTGSGNPLVGFYIDRAYPIVVRIHKNKKSNDLYVYNHSWAKNETVSVGICK
jgi:hypothetical protein